MTALNLSDIQALADELDNEGVDLNNAASGGGDYEPPEAGPTRLRLVGYVETGVHTETSRQFGAKTKARCEITFELSGPKHPAKDIDGTLYPHRIVIRESIGYHEKNGYMKLFKLLNHDGTAKNFAALVGKAWRGTITHRKYKGADGKERVAANLKNEQGYQIFPTSFADPETGEIRTVKVDAAISPLRCFLWDKPSIPFWNSIFIDGAYDDGSSKNKLQEKCVSAENFIGSPLQLLLLENKLPIPQPKPKAAQADPLASSDETPETPAQKPAENPAAAEAEAPADEAPEDDDAQLAAALALIAANKAKKAATKPAKPAAAAGKGRVATGAVDPLQGL